MMEIKFSVLIISYNQEKYISDCIASVINQSVLPYEIIISDDCSTDRTWDIITNYGNNYPGLIKAYRQPANVGLYQNLNSAFGYLTGDILCGMGGDDFFEKGLFENLYKVVQQNNIQPAKDAFIIVTNTAHYYPNGKVTVWNNYRLKSRNMFKEQLRGGVSLRWIGYSMNLKDYFRAPENMGYGADSVRNTILLAHCPNYYFADFISTYYRVGVGVTSKLKVRHFAEHNKNVIPVIKESLGHRLDKKDQLYLDYAQSLISYQLNTGIKNYARVLLFFIRNVNNFAMNNGFMKQIKFFVPFKTALYTLRRLIYRY
jgi:glycosyltransferase involved in cell wall biosynthesis